MFARSRPLLTCLIALLGLAATADVFGDQIAGAMRFDPLDQLCRLVSGSESTVSSTAPSTPIFAETDVPDASDEQLLPPPQVRRVMTEVQPVEMDPAWINQLSAKPIGADDVNWTRVHWRQATPTPKLKASATGTVLVIHVRRFDSNDARKRLHRHRAWRRILAPRERMPSS